MYALFIRSLQAFCLTTKSIRPWINVKALEEYKTDTLQAVLDRNEVSTPSTVAVMATVR